MSAGRVALVTGAAQGIGAAIADALAAERAVIDVLVNWAGGRARISRAGWLEARSLRRCSTRSGAT